MLRLNLVTGELSYNWSDKTAQSDDGVIAWQKRLAVDGKIGAVTAAAGFGVPILASTGISGVVPVKADTANSSHVVSTTTIDTASGIVIGVAVNSPSANNIAEVVTSGLQNLALGTGTCAISQFVVVDTTTNGSVKCTSTYTAGSIIGVAMQAQSTVGSTFSVMVGLR